MTGLNHRSFKCPVPIINNHNKTISDYNGKKLMIVSFLEGKAKQILTPDDCKQVGVEVAKMHEITKEFTVQRNNNLSINSWRKLFNSVKDRCVKIDKDLPKLIEANLVDVEKMLGRPYSIIGKVFHGDKRGRKLGFPTANVLLKRRNSPLNGVFAVKVKTNKGTFNGVANIGSRPTVNGGRQHLEVHVFEFNDDLYGQCIEVIIKKKLRQEMKFDDLNALTAQIKLDSEQAKQALLVLN